MSTVWLFLKEENEWGDNPALLFWKGPFWWCFIRSDSRQMTHLAFTQLSMWVIEKRNEKTPSRASLLLIPGESKSCFGGGGRRGGSSGLWFFSNLLSTCKAVTGAWLFLEVSPRSSTALGELWSGGSSDSRAAQHSRLSLGGGVENWKFQLKQTKKVC